MIKMIPSYDMDSINAVMKDDEMWPRVSAPGQIKDTFYMMPKQGDIFVKAIMDDQMCGFYYLHPLTDSAYIIHANILKDYRIYSFDLSSGILEWCKNSLPAKTLVAHIPEHHTDVIGHTLKMGFYRIGVIPEASATKEGYSDVHVFARGNK